MYFVLNYVVCPILEVFYYVTSGFLLALHFILFAIFRISKRLMLDNVELQVFCSNMHRVFKEIRVENGRITNSNTSKD